jgi:hypothetical protein
MKYFKRFEKKVLSKMALASLEIDLSILKEEIYYYVNEINFYNSKLDVLYKKYWLDFVNANRNKKEDEKFIFCENIEERIKDTEEKEKLQKELKLIEDHIEFLQKNIDLMRELLKLNNE